MRTTRKIMLAPAAALLFGLQATLMPVHAEEMKHDMSKGDMSTMTTASPEGSADAGYKAAMNKMHREMMAQKYTGDADVDFVRGMIPHHQAAIDMAKVLLEHGKDPQLRKLAKNIISAQETEIEEMENWLEAHPAK